MSDMETYKSRFDERGWRVFAGAVAEARGRGQNYVSPEHVIKNLADVEGELFGALLGSLGIAPDAFYAAVEKRVEAGPRHAGGGARLDQGVVEMLKRALGWGRWRGRDRIGAADILVALSQEEQGPFVEIFAALGSEPLTVLRTVRDVAAEVEQQSRKEVTVPSENNARLSYKRGDTVRIKSGAFSSMTAKVTGADSERSTITAAVRVFGGSRVIELGFSDVEKISFERT